MNEKLIRFMLSVALAITPIGANGVGQWIQGASFASLPALLSRGDLLLITVGVCGTSLLELIGAGAKYKFAKLLATGVILVVLIFSLFSFGYIAAASAVFRPVSTEVVYLLSLGLFIPGTTASILSVWLSKDQ